MAIQWSFSEVTPGGLAEEYAAPWVGIPFDGLAGRVCQDLVRHSYELLMDAL